MVRQRDSQKTIMASVASVTSAILSFLRKILGFVAKHAWALIVFVVGLVGVFLMKLVSYKKLQPFQ